MKDAPKSPANTAELLPDKIKSPPGIDESSRPKAAAIGSFAVVSTVAMSSLALFLSFIIVSRGYIGVIIFY